ncbi:hypothetical protein C8J56DRAFT_1045899 [Mycena floridula]|nr:hypothetical protein C8J56DRAFT_1045899 [Mycena floridula]
MLTTKRRRDKSSYPVQADAAQRRYHARANKAAAKESIAAAESVDDRDLGFPVEILRNIFSLATHGQFWEELDRCRPCPAGLVPAAISIASVCRSWRAVMTHIAMKDSWSFIYAPCSRSVGQAKSYEKHISRCADLSRRSPLRILLHMDGTGIGSGPLDPARIIYIQSLHRLLQTCQLWRTVSITVTASVNFAAVILGRARVQGKMPLMKSLRLDLRNLKDEGLLRGSTSVLAGLAFGLRCLDWQHGFKSTSIFDPGWKSLTQIRIADRSAGLQQCLRVLELCYHLEEYQFTYDARDCYRVSLTAPPHKCRYLHTLRILPVSSHTMVPQDIHPSHFVSLGTMLGGFIMPFLADLRIESIYSTWYSDLTPGFLQQTSLTTLDIRCDELTEFQLVKCLASIPSLLHLKLAETAQVRDFFNQKHTMTITDEVILRLTHGVTKFDSPCLLPHLQTLDMEGAHFSMALFVKMSHSLDSLEKTLILDLWKPVIDLSNSWRLYKSWGCW